MNPLELFPKSGKLLKLVKPFVDILPKDWLYTFYRNQIEVPQTLPKELSIRVANTLKEIEEAFSIIHANYRKHDLIDIKKTESLVTKFHLLPTTTVVVALWNNEIIGTITLINDSPLGLPSEGLYSFNDLRKQNTLNLAEGAFFAIREEHEKTVALPLIKYFYELARRFHNIDTLILPLPDNKNVNQIYEAIFFIKSISKETYTPHPYLNYGSVRLYQLNYLFVNKQMVKHYWLKPPSKDLLNFLYNCEFSNFEYPEEVSQKWSADDLRQLFSENDELKESLSEFEKICLKEFYKESIYENILPAINPEIIRVEDRRVSKQNQSNNVNIINERRLAFYSREIRFKTNFTGILHSQQLEIPVTINDVSLNGMRLTSQQALKIGHQCTLKAQLDHDYKFDVVIKNIWAKKNNNVYGFRVEEDKKTWSNLIHYLIEREEAV